MRILLVDDEKAFLVSMKKEILRLCAEKDYDVNVSMTDGMVTNCLGAGMAFNIFIQSYNQLKSKYEMDEDTIKDNFANQVFILQVGKDSAEEFSVQLGNKTVVELQRSGTILSMKKSMMEKLALTAARHAVPLAAKLPTTQESTTL